MDPNDFSRGLVYTLVVGLIAFLLTFRLPPNDPPPRRPSSEERAPQPQPDDPYEGQRWAIRKLHLVRPDLILYPLFIETVC